MSRRSYNQACSLAVALDLIGERWTWLIIRALLTGPKRYGELSSQLPGMGTNLLSERLKGLLAYKIAEKTGEGKQSAYQLTPLGEELRPITHQLILWGSRFANVVTEKASMEGAFSTSPRTVPRRVGTLGWSTT